jgi:hypothetical protein
MAFQPPIATYRRNVILHHIPNSENQENHAEERSGEEKAVGFVERAAI